VSDEPVTRLECFGLTAASELRYFSGSRLLDNGTAFKPTLAFRGETDCRCSLLDSNSPSADRIIHTVSAAVFDFSFASKGLPQEWIWPEPCLHGFSGAPLSPSLAFELLSMVALVASYFRARRPARGEGRSYHRDPLRVR
jgi:hypothetical protein